MLLLLLLLMVMVWSFFTCWFRVGPVMEVLVLLLLLLMYGRGHYVAGDSVVPRGRSGRSCRDRVSLGCCVLDVVLLEKRREASGRETGRGRHAVRETGGKVREQRMRRHLDASRTTAGLLPCASRRRGRRTTVTVGSGRGSRGVQP